MKLHIQLRKARLYNDLTQEELAKKLGVSRQTVFALESGRCFPSIPLALKMARLFRMPLEALFLPENKFKSIPMLNREKGGKMPKDYLAPWSPFPEFARLRDEMDRLFEETLSPLSTRAELAGPPVNLYQTPQEVVIKAEVPGIAEKDIDIQVTDDSVTISGEKKQEEEIKEKDYYHRESRYGSFLRTLALPTPVKSEGAKAELSDGILTVRIPKTKVTKPKITKIKPKAVKKS